MDIFKEAVRRLSIEHLLSIMPANILREHQPAERKKINKLKQEAFHLFMRFWKYYTQRLRSQVSVYGKISNCHFFGTFAKTSHNNLMSENDGSELKIGFIPSAELLKFLVYEDNVFTLESETEA